MALVEASAEPLNQDSPLVTHTVFLRGTRWHRSELLMIMCLLSASPLSYKLPKARAICSSS